MSTYQRRFVGAEQLPRHLTEFDVEQFFRLLPDDIVAIRDRFRADCQTQVEIDTEVKRKRSEELIHRFMWELLV